MLAVIVVMGLPMLNVLAVSLSTQAGSENPGLVLFPSPATLEGYRFIWSYINLWRPFVNTAYVAVVGTILHVILSAMGGYVLMQRGLPLRKIMTTFVILTMTIPGELTLVSIYQVNRDFGLVNRFAGLIMNGAASGFSILLMRNYFMSIPQSLAEAARMDGSSELSTFLRIYLRLAVPATMTVATLAVHPPVEQHRPRRDADLRSQEDDPARHPAGDARGGAVHLGHGLHLRQRQDGGGGHLGAAADRPVFLGTALLRRGRHAGRHEGVSAEPVDGITASRCEASSFRGGDGMRKILAAAMVLAIVASAAAFATGTDEATGAVLALAGGHGRQGRRGEQALRGRPREGDGSRDHLGEAWRAATTSC